MATAPLLNLNSYPDSPYATELKRSAANLRFVPQLESEYRRAALRHSRTLIRVACLLAALLAVLRGTEQVIATPRDMALLVGFSLIVATSCVLAAIAWSTYFERAYSHWASVLVPIRNCIIAWRMADAAAHGQTEMLMILPTLVMGPFFFQGLRYRVALFTCVLSGLSYICSSVFYKMTLPVALHSNAVLFAGVIACAVAARHVEKSSRISFLESHIIEELAQHDALTGTKNRRVLDEYLLRLWHQAIEDSRAIAILLIDVDHFKAYNDRYGHQAGDETLRRVAQTAQRFVRRPLDILARYGGEEFAAVLYDVDGNQAKDVAERIRRAVAELGIEHRGSRTSAAVTVSVGVAIVEPTPERTAGGALQLADQALYEAKVRGRNRVEIMDEAEHRMLVTGVFATISQR